MVLPRKQQQWSIREKKNKIGDTDLTLFKWILKLHLYMQRVQSKVYNTDWENASKEDSNTALI